VHVLIKFNYSTTIPIPRLKLKQKIVLHFFNF